MVFSRIEFLYYFLPITLFLYFITPAPGGSPRLKNTILLAASMVFYAWGEPIYVLLMAAQCTAAWLFGLLMDRYRSKAKGVMLISAAFSLSGLLLFKYANFFIVNINSIAGLGLPQLRAELPVGISFYTFQILSYTVDLYRGKVEVQRNLIDFSSYVALFPQLIAGPIVRYSDIAAELKSRRVDIPGFAKGARRFIIGLGKKVLLANLLGELVDIFKHSGDSSVLFVWIYLVAYSLHIYFDFSGYSDMAIGLGHMLGFTFPENFNYPYIAGSITDFWRRWHMTLSGWFRDYVYIPLGGNRVSVGRFMVNIMVVWALTGFWHGADWNFILWGLYFGLILLIEKHFLGKLLDRWPRPLRHAYVLFVVLISWTLFDAQGLSEILSRVGRVFGAGSSGFAGREALYYLRSYMLPLAAGLIGCTPLPKLLMGKLERAKPISGILTFAEPLALAALLLTATAFIVDGSFNPFIYFRF
ncbi:MAG: MBOAT family protein [Clostridiales bacterium]|nr:MBOAT family protein [Clostridiales bacterium]